MGPAATNSLKEGKSLTRLQDAPLSPFYLFSGKERFFIRRGIDIIRNRVITPKDLSEILHHPLYGVETNIEELLSLAQTPPFFEKTQLILVREAEKLNESCKKGLAQYADQPAPFTCIVLVTGEKIPNHQLFKKVQTYWPQACLVFSKLNRNQRKKWVEVILKEKGLKKKIPAILLSELLEETSMPLEILENQIEILSLYLEGEKPGSIDTSLPPTWTEVPTEQGYLLTDALLKGDEQETLVLLQKFLEKGTPPLLILSRIIWEVRRIQQLQEGMERGDSIERILRSARIPPFKKNLYISMARRVPGSIIRKIFLTLLEKDRALKSSRLNPQWHLEDLCRQFLQAVNVGQ